VKWLFALFLAGCTAATSGGAPASPEVIPIPPTPPGVVVIIDTFVATWCGPCKIQLPKVQDELDSLSKSVRGQIEFRLHVIDVDAQASADKYRDQLGLDAKAFPDMNGKVFRSMKIGSSIPAGIVLDKDGKVLKRYPAGGMSFVPSEIVKFAASHAK